ncbi:unnamed protein product [Mytilus edulis]|uniref:EGF-like domain-containing protein n=1 Tax=Mytilus edulis TaxID=6550 RepID=A0A8S3UBF2_MYTED|nr:unnamed protein product [Mytilus edulis]
MLHAGGEVRMRQYICCDKRLIDKSLNACLTSCNIPFSWWQAHATEYKTCGKCTRGGTYDTTHNRCSCPDGFGGSCCNIRTTTTTTATTTRSTTKSTTKSTTISTTKSTAMHVSTTISKRTTPTTHTSLLTSSLIIMTTKPVCVTKKVTITYKCQKQ